MKSSTMLMAAALLIFDAALALAERPNILLIMADDVGVDVLGCYGGESYRTPRLDALAAGGMRFNHCYSMPVCHPTRITLMTGRYPFRTGNPKWGSFPAEEEQSTFAHVLKNAGYATAVAGKWQICMMKNDLDHARRLGFDESCLFGWHEGARYHSPLIYQNGRLRLGLEDRYGPDVYVEFLIDFMERTKSKPFFAYYPMALCHDVTDDLTDPVPFGPDGHYDTFKQMAEAMDVRVGRLIDALDRLGLRENTLVLFTTDNGTPTSYIHSAEPNPDPTKKDKYIRIPVVSKHHGMEVPGGKGSLTNGGTNVPLIANWPGKIQPSQVASDLVDFSDFLPTLAEFARADLSAGIPLDGHSFASRLIDGQPSPRTWAFAEHGKKYWVRDRRWKLYDDGRLYDVENDPREREPVLPEAGSPMAASARTRLSKVMASLNYE